MNISGLNYGRKNRDLGLCDETSSAALKATTSDDQKTIN